MSEHDPIGEAFADFLSSRLGARDSIQLDTDLLESGCLDSLLVMDLVRFAEARFKVRMEPQDINPDNLRSLRCLADYVQRKLSQIADAA
jgi:acyl carrier protein